MTNFLEELLKAALYLYRREQDDMCPRCRRGAEYVAADGHASGCDWRRPS